MLAIGNSEPLPDNLPDKLKELLRKGRAEAGYDDKGNKTPDSVDLTSQQVSIEDLRVAVGKQLDVAYYNGLDRKGWSNYEEDRAIDAILRLCEAAALAELEKCRVDGMFIEWNGLNLFDMNEFEANIHRSFNHDT